MQGLFFRLVVFAFFFTATGIASASDLVEVLPLNNRILVLHFEDGSIDYAQHDFLGGRGRDVKIIRSPLNTAVADTPGSYSITATGDTKYREGVQPLKVGRKSKTRGMPNWPPGEYVLEHWVYLELPYPLQTGETYSVSTGDLAANGNEVTFTYDAFELRSEAIHVNQVGYVPAAPLKIGYIFHYMGSRGHAGFESFEGNDCFLIDSESKQVAFTSQLTFWRPTAPDNGQGDHWIDSDVWACDFSSFTTPGEYYLVVEGVGRSFPFRVSVDVYREPYYTSVRGFYHQRSGARREEPYSRWFKEEDHIPGRNGHRVLYSNFRWMDSEGQDHVFEQLPAHKTSVEMPDAWGGWFDAADWDRHAEHLLVVNQLLMAYAFNPSAFNDDDLDLPESGNGIPDIIDEARFEVDFFLRLKGPTGGISGGLETSGHPGDEPSYDDPFKEWYQFAEEPFASFWTAAAAAQLGHSLAIAGKDGLAKTYLNEAAGIYDWAQQNLKPGDIEVIRADGRTTRDVRMLAAAWLFNTTGQARYHDQIKQDNHIISATSPLVQNGYNQEYAVWAYLLGHHPNSDQDVRNRFKLASLNYARDYVKAAEARTLQIANNWWFPTVVGGLTTPRLVPVIVAHYLTRDEPSEAEEYLQYLYTSADYFLGANPLNMTWMTGIGERSPGQIMHLDSWYDGLVEPVPGIVPYGPESPLYSGGSEGSWTPLHHYFSCYPDYNEWPLAELWFESRYPVMSAEFTIWQTMGYTSLLYSYLYGLSGEDQEVGIEAGEMPDNSLNVLRMEEGHPNPFDGKTTLYYELPVTADIDVVMFDLLGREVQRIYTGLQSSGRHRLEVDGSTLAPGAYVVRLATADHSVSRILLRH